IDRFWTDAGHIASDIPWRGSARTDALGRNHFLGFALSGSAGTDDRLWLRHAQFFHLLQCRRGPAISPAGDSGAVRIGFGTPAAGTSKPMCSEPAAKPGS